MKNVVNSNFLVLQDGMVADIPIGTTNQEEVICCIRHAACEFHDGRQRCS